MSTSTNAPPPPVLLVQPFPEPGPLVRLAYRELSIAATGTPEHANALGDHRLLPRPWDPATCGNPELRTQVWAWLDAVATWLNSEYVWDVTGIVPACWPRHPHLVHEIAVLADQRRGAGIALSGDAMEEWHRYSLPAFTDRMRARVATHCEDGHQPWPAKGRHVRHGSGDSRAGRADAFSSDTRATATADQKAVVRRLSVVDPQTGVVTDI